MSRASKTFHWNNNNSVIIFQERSWDVRFNFTSLDINTDSINFEFPISGNKSPNTVQAVYDILTSDESESIWIGDFVNHIVSRVAEIWKILEITMNDTHITFTGSDATKETTNSISVQFLATPIQLFQFHQLVLAILDDNKNYTIGH